jgi:putative tricarboxylic transport membrane protein
MRRTADVTDLLSGLFLIGTGLFALALTWPLPVGSALRMGPGYIPQMLCYIQLGIGSLVVVQSIARSGKPWELWGPRPIVWILASIIFFAVAIDRLGLVASVIGFVLLTCLARSGWRPLEVVFLAAGLSLFSVLIFVVLLELTIPVWPRLGM